MTRIRRNDVIIEEAPNNLAEVLKIVYQKGAPPTIEKEPLDLSVAEGYIKLTPDDHNGSFKWGPGCVEARYKDGINVRAIVHAEFGNLVIPMKEIIDGGWYGGSSDRLFDTKRYKMLQNITRDPYPYKIISINDIGLNLDVGSLRTLVEFLTYNIKNPDFEGTLKANVGHVSEDDVYCFESFEYLKKSDWIDLRMSTDLILPDPNLMPKSDIQPEPEPESISSPSAGSKIVKVNNVYACINETIDMHPNGYAEVRTSWGNVSFPLEGFQTHTDGSKYYELFIDIPGSDGLRVWAYGKPSFSCLEGRVQLFVGLVDRNGNDFGELKDLEITQFVYPPQ